jgi:hypothetical protein
MKEYVVEALKDVLIFFVFGAYTLIARTNAAKTPLNLRQKFNVFYMAVASGWGIYSLLLGVNPWVGEPPQKIFIIMTATVAGTNTVAWLKRKQIIQKLIDVLIK